MNYFYLLRSLKRKWIYSGSTKDLRTRFNEHNNGKVKSTKFYKPFELLYYEAYKTYHLARKREVEIKKNSQQKELLLKRLEISNNGEV